MLLTLSDGRFQISRGVLRKYLGSEQSVTVPDGVHTVARHAFQSIRTLQEVILPSGVQVLQKEAFFCCPDLRRVHIPASTGTIRCRTFSDCPGLEEILLHPDSRNFRVSAGVLLSEQGTCAFFCPRGLAGEVHLPDGIRRISTAAFQDCRFITALTMPDSVKCVERAAFRDCTSLRSLRFSDALTILEPETCRGCRSLTEVHLPENLQKITQSVFHHTALTELTLPPALESIGYRAFAGSPVTHLIFRGSPSILNLHLACLRKDPLRITADHADPSELSQTLQDMILQDCARRRRSSDPPPDALLAWMRSHLRNHCLHYWNHDLFRHVLLEEGLIGPRLFLQFQQMAAQAGDVELNAELMEYRNRFMVRPKDTQGLVPERNWAPQI